MEWKDEYALGIKVVDAQHRQLFRLSDELDAALKAGVRADEIDSLLAQMGEYAVKHFTMEEKYMTESKYPGLAEQQKLHQVFAARFGEMYEEFKDTGLTQEIVESLRRELTDWVRKHVTGMDQRFGEYFKKRQA